MILCFNYSNLLCLLPLISSTGCRLSRVLQYRLIGTKHHHGKKRAWSVIVEWNHELSFNQIYLPPMPCDDCWLFSTSLYIYFQRNTSLEPRIYSLDVIDPTNVLYMHGVRTTLISEMPQINHLLDVCIWHCFAIWGLFVYQTVIV